MEQKCDTPEQAEFRDYCRRWLADNRPAVPSFRLPEYAIEVMTEEQRQYLCDWQKQCYQAGLVACDFPAAYGGGGHTGFQRIANQELSLAGVPYLINVIGLSMAAPTILHHGTDEQKTRYLPPLFSADEIWCQGFSEPNAGSDLASVQTSAVREGDNWIINGHKVWTSLAHFASWMILLARHSSGDKYSGLTYFLCPIADTPGVTVRPLIKITGQTGFNEVLFENVVVSDSLRVDAVGSGWQVAMTTLTHERGAAEGAGSGGGASIEDRLAALMALAKKMKRNGKPAWDDAVIRDRIMQLAVRIEGFRQTFRRARVAALTDHPMRIPLSSKLLLSEISQDMSALALDIEGAYGSLYLRDARAPDAADWPLAYLNSYGFTIAAGTSEIQRNILGERVLGLAKTK
jgi:alkylation response protein AidB-like acyl-CoA dehydrogenase